MKILDKLKTLLLNLLMRTIYKNDSIMKNVSLEAKNNSLVVRPDKKVLYVYGNNTWTGKTVYLKPQDEEIISL